MSQAPRVAAIVLAAGRSTRMGAGNKLLADIAGTPMVRHVVEAALGSRARPVLVVIGHQAEAVRAALAGLDVAIRRQPGLRDRTCQLAEGRHPRPASDCAGALVLLGDMPLIAPAHLDRADRGVRAGRHRRADAPRQARQSRAVVGHPFRARCCNSTATPAPAA